MLMPISARSWPEAHNSASRARTWPGEGKNSGRTRPSAVLTYQRMPRTAKTAAAMPRNSVVLMRSPSVKRRERPVLLGRGIHEPGIDGARQIDVLLQDAGGARRLVHFRNDLAGEVRHLGLVLGQRIIDDAVESRGEL